jgi:group I intron endonuclease
MENLYKSKGIYGIRNKINNKIYVGQTIVNFGDRRDSSYSSLRYGKKQNKNFQEEWLQYGEINFEFIILKLVENDDLINIDEYEKEFIKYYKDKNLCYNITLGGKGALGLKLSEEQKKQIGERNRIIMTGRKATQETKNKMSKSHKGFIISQEHKEKLRNANLGKKTSEETKEKLRISHQGSKCHFAKYTEDNVYLAKLMFKQGYSKNEIIEKTGISKDALRFILNGKRWKHIIL